MIRQATQILARSRDTLMYDVAGVAALALLVLPPLLADDVGAFWEGMLGLVMLLVMALLYILPSLIAWKYYHEIYKRNRKSRKD